MVPGVLHVLAYTAPCGRRFLRRTGLPALVLPEILFGMRSDRRLEGAHMGPGELEHVGAHGLSEGDSLDFLALLGEWDSVGSSCDFGLGAPGVGIDEFLDLLANWGPCP